MRYLLTSLLCFLTLSLTAQEPLTYPFNPDANGDTFVGVSDVLEGISTYDNFFFPEEIMVGDTTLSSWIQILNQTLSNQQAVIDSLQASLDSQDTQLDSTMIADMIAAAGGFGSGGGCDLRFPDGLDGKVVTFRPIETSYIVPENKRLYVIFNGADGSHDIWLNGVFIELDNVNNYPIILNENDSISVPPNTGGSGFMNGILVDAENTLEPIWLIEPFLQSMGPYQVPEGKILVVLYTNYIENLWLNGLNSYTSGNETNLPLLIPELTNISCTNLADFFDIDSYRVLHGYLVDEDYFADCGGGGSGEGGLLNNIGFGDREHLDINGFNWQSLNGGWSFFEVFNPDQDGLFSYDNPCGNNMELIVISDTLVEENFTDSFLTENAIFKFEDSDQDVFCAVNANEKIVFSGSVPDDDNCLGATWLPLISNTSDSSEGVSGGVSVSTFGDTLTVNGESVIVPGISMQNNTPNFGSVTDIDGNTYQTIIINGKEWMAEDLLVSKYSNGTPIPQYTASSNGNSNYNPNCLNPRYVYVSNEGGSYIPRAYYNAYAIETSNICPSNWHVATVAEYTEVFQIFSSTDTTDSYYGNGNGYPFEWENAGPALKNPNSGWTVNYTSSGMITGQATNESYLAIESYNNPGCTYINQFNVSNGNTQIYTSTPAAVNGGNYCVSLSDNDRVSIADNPSYHLHSVRCVKD